MEGTSRSTARRVFSIFLLALSSAWLPSALAEVSLESTAADQPGDDRPAPIQAKLSEPETLRFLKSEILEFAVTLPTGAVIQIPRDVPPSNYRYRDQQGSVQVSSNFFYGQIQVISVEPKDAGNFPPERIAALNATVGGLYVSSAVVDDFDEGVVPALKPSEPGADFLKSYEPGGKPKFNYTQTFVARFGEKLNLAIDPAKQSEAERRKWSAIYEELKRVGTRTAPMDSLYLFMPVEDARKFSQLFEEKGIVQPGGAWSIAVKGTAVRHGFPNVPCAEFQSEIIRQAYLRAGYSHFDDFNAAKGNTLIWSSTAAVVNLATALFKAGWIPWEAVKFKPVPGAIVMNAKATTPGHTYMAAGEDGRFVMDNGSPRGRDLRATSDRIISMMYRSGVFFLPPGIVPSPW